MVFATVSPARRHFSFLLFAVFGLTIAHARLGETLSKISDRLGSPAGSPTKNVQVWYFEVQDGQVLYTVTFNAKGQSIAEGLKPLKQAVFSPELANSFINSEVEPYMGSKTLLHLAPGEKYRFAGKDLVCGEKETVVVDDARGFLLVWAHERQPTIIVVSPEVMQ